MNLRSDTSRGPAFSVIVPTCQRHEALRRCLQQLEPGHQTLPPEEYEVIVTDDGIDTAQQLVQETFPWARWIAGPRCGPAANRNHGAAHARGEWLAFTDDDCLPSPRWLSEYRSAARPTIAVYEGKTTCNEGLRSPLQHAPINTTGGCLWSCNMMVLRRFFFDIGGFDQRFPFAHMEDAEFKERAQAKAEIKFVPGATVDHPPRRLPFGVQLARHQECRVCFDRIHHQETASIRLLAEIAQCRLQAVRRFALSMDSFRALASLIVELAAVSLLMPRWKRKYRAPSKV